MNGAAGMIAGQGSIIDSVAALDAAGYAMVGPMVRVTWLSTTPVSGIFIRMHDGQQRPVTISDLVRKTHTSWRNYAPNRLISGCCLINGLDSTVASKHERPGCRRTSAQMEKPRNPNAARRETVSRFSGGADVEVRLP